MNPRIHSLKTNRSRALLHLPSRDPSDWLQTASAGARELEKSQKTIASRELTCQVRFCRLRKQVKSRVKTRLPPSRSVDESNMIEFNEDETTASSHAVSMSGESTCAALSHWTCIALSVRKPRGIGTTRYVILSERSRVFDNLFTASGPFFSSCSTNVSSFCVVIWKGGGRFRVYKIIDSFRQSVKVHAEEKVSACL